MHDFRLLKAYRGSLYLLLLSFVAGGLVFLSDDLRLYMVTLVGVFFVPLLLIISIFLRFISLNPLKRWADIVLIFLATTLQFFVSAMSHTCPAYVINTPAPQWTLASVIDICSKYNIFTYIQVISFILLGISLFLAIRFLILDLKK